MSNVLSRRALIKTLTASAATLGLGRFWNGGAAAAISATDPDSPFTWPHLTERGAEIAGSLGYPRLRDLLHASCFPGGDCGGAEFFSRVNNVYPGPGGEPLQRGLMKFFEIFPGGTELARFTFLLANTDWSSPKFQGEPHSLGRQYLEGAGAPSAEVTLISISQLPDSLPSWQLFIEEEVGRSVWQKYPERPPAIAAATTMVALASANALARLEPLLPASRQTATPVLARVQEIAIAAVQRAMLTDMLGPSPLGPVVELVAAGYVPLGPTGGSFTVLMPSQH